MFERPSKQIGICKLMSLKWFELNESQLRVIIQDLVDARCKLVKRKEYLKRKAELKGNKFINEEGNIVIMNRKFNKDLREDLL